MAPLLRCPHVFTCHDHEGHVGWHSFLDGLLIAEQEGCPVQGQCIEDNGHPGGHQPPSSDALVPTVAPEGVPDEAAQCPYMDTLSGHQCIKSRNHVSDHRFNPQPDEADVAEANSVLAALLDPTPTRWSLTDEMQGFVEVQGGIDMTLLRLVRDNVIPADTVHELIASVGLLALLAEAAGAKR